MTGAIIKGIGLAASAIGVGATLVSDWVQEKKMEEKIDRKVNEALSRYGININDDENEEEEP